MTSAPILAVGLWLLPQGSPHVFLGEEVHIKYTPAAVNIERESDNPKMWLVLLCPEHCSVPNMGLDGEHHAFTFFGSGRKADIESPTFSFSPCWDVAARPPSTHFGPSDYSAPFGCSRHSYLRVPAPRGLRDRPKFTYNSYVAIERGGLTRVYYDNLGDNGPLV